MNTNTKSSDEFAAGEEALKNAADLIAKAAEADLDADFNEYDEAAAASAEGDEEGMAGEGAEGAEPGSAPPIDEDLADEDEDEDEDEEGGEAPAEFAKADAVVTVDALPILRALDERLAEIAAMQRAQLGIAKAQQSAIQHFSKAQDAIAGLPRKPKSATVTVPTATPPAAAPDINALFAKAAEVVDDPRQFGLVEHYFNRKDRTGLLDVLTPEQRKTVLGS